MQPKIFFIDTYYADVFQHFKDKISSRSYDQRRKDTLALFFGTADYYSVAFNKTGWKAEDIIANDPEARRLWNAEHGYGNLEMRESVMAQILLERPQVVYMQDLSFFNPEQLREIKSHKILLTGQHSCPWAGDDQVKEFEFMFTSFPHYMDRLEKLGVEHDFLQIAFGGSRVLDTLGLNNTERPFDLTFVGGVGRHWGNGNYILETVAKRIDEFQWYGYGRELLPDCLLKRIWQGPAWGSAMYKVYAYSKMVLNRHGEVAEGYANNMRLFEATGCGALLFTEAAKNLDYYFEPDKECVTYQDEFELIEKIQYYLRHDDERKQIARAGQKRTLTGHCYDQILEKPSRTLKFIAES